MRRICMVAYTHYPTDARVRREAEALAERGDEVDFICLKGKGVENTTMLNKVRLIPVSIGRYRGSNSVKYLMSYFMFFMAVFFLLAYLQIKNRYQIIQVHTMPDFMVFTALIPKILGAKVILDVHDLMPEIYQSKFNIPESHWAIRMITWMERRSVDFSDRSIAVSQPHLNALIKHGVTREKFIALLNLPDSKYFGNLDTAVDESDPAFTLIYHGTVAKRHGLEVAIQAVSNLKDEILNLKLLVIGEGDNIPGIIDLVKELGVGNQVEIRVGFIPPEEVIPIICRAHVGIVPILDNDFTRYALPVKLLEYIALKKPVICSRTEAIECYFDDSLIQFFKPGSVDELTEQIRFLYRNPEKRRQLSANADEFNRKYNWNMQKHLYYQLIDGLIHKNARDK